MPDATTATMALNDAFDKTFHRPTQNPFDIIAYRSNEALSKRDRYMDLYFSLKISEHGLNFNDFFDLEVSEAEWILERFIKKARREMKEAEIAKQNAEKGKVTY